MPEILSWEQRKETERDTKFVELGRYLCEVRAGQYWRVEDLKSFEEFLQRKVSGVPEEGLLPPQARKGLVIARAAIV